MKIYTLFFLLLVALNLYPDSGQAKQQRPVGFSAKVVRSDSTHQEPSNSGMMYVGHSGIRTETNKDQQPVWMIFKPEQKIVWTLFPKQKMYMERVGLSLEWPPLPEDKNSPCKNEKFRCQKVGWKKINNRSVIHWKIDLMGVHGKSFYAQLWVDPRLNVAIRETYADGLTVEMHQIHEAPQAASLFELPEGYRKVTLPARTESPPEKGKTSR